MSGNSCARGEEYGVGEAVRPVRVITSTVVVEGAMLPRCPVRTNGAIPKDKIMEAMKTLDRVLLKAPVKYRQIVVENVCETGIDFVTTRELF